MHLDSRVKILLIITLFLATPGLCHAQQLLNKVISIDVKKKPVSTVLKNIGAQGDFYFSYNSNILGTDSLISISAKNKTVREVLDMMFNGAYEYEETGKHIVLQKATVQFWYATGYVIDGTTGERVVNASVYEKQQFVSTLTNEHGYFRLKLKDKLRAVTLYISRNLYYDTAVTIVGSNVQEISIGISPKPVTMDSFVVRLHQGVEKNWLGKFFTSSKQRVQSVNLGRYFVDKPYQGSIIPGLSSHGKMSTQVVNKVSFNMIGGYTAGVNGVELGGVFNIVKNDVRYAQIAGLTNIVGGNVNGVQVAGLYNQVLDASRGWQFAGLCNVVNDSLRGIQIAGGYNHIWGDLKGIQVSGAGNYVNGKTKGVQITGAANYTNKDMQGTQISGAANIAMGNVDGAQISGAVNITTKDLKGTQIGVVNIANRVKGVQIGIINIADTSEGASLGLLNFVWKGYHKLSISNNEALTFTLSGKLGSKRLYSIVFAGMHTGTKQQAWSFGYGYGSEITLSKKWALNPEATLQQVYLGDWEYANLLFRGTIHLSYKINRYISINAGPSYNYFHSKQKSFIEGYNQPIYTDGAAVEKHLNDWTSWLGWNAGITIF